MRRAGAVLLLTVVVAVVAFVAFVAVAAVVAFVAFVAVSAFPVRFPTNDPLVVMLPLTLSEPAIDWLPFPVSCSQLAEAVSTVIQF